MNATRRVFFNTTALTAMKLLGLLVSFIVTPFTIHELGMADYGLWAILSGMVNYFTLVDFGAGSTFITQFSLFYAESNRQGIREVMTFGIVFYLTLGLILVPVAWFVAPHLTNWFHVAPVESSMVTRVFWCTYAYLFVSQAVGGFGTLLNAAQKMVFTSVLGFVSQLLNSLILIVSLVMHLSLYSFVIANYASLAASTVATLLAARRCVSGPLTCPPWRIRPEIVKKLFSFGAWMQINNLSNQVNMETDRVLIGMAVSAEATGVYQLANKLALLCRYLPLNLLGALLPAFSDMEVQGEKSKIRMAYVEGSRYLALMSFYVAGFTLAASAPITVVWLGKLQPSLIPMLALLLVSYVINNLTGVGTTFLRAVAKPRLETYYAVLGSVLNIILTLVLAPKFGMWGILWGTVIGSAIGSVYFLWIFNKSIHVSWWEGLLAWIWPIAATTVISGALVYLFSTLSLGAIGDSRLVAAVATVGLGIVYTISFIGCLRVFRCFSEEDRARFLSVLPDRLVRPSIKWKWGQY
ncbi:oligosaccharide flippase family protein [Alicyclobacillus pomorum]|uniref:oligosaccharide flippase family protein n=1 Tax=Alicyclobacillus pomorum TaxID=204470 RepID=UPI00041BA230|nr:oligosaccharide flippase family protein [Alicyclobacillus pomorum]